MQKRLQSSLFDKHQFRSLRSSKLTHSLTILLNEHDKKDHSSYLDEKSGDKISNHEL